MIVDLQGVGNVLTDPQIHCLDKGRFGKGNLGYQGMLMFFNTHQCNEHCRALGLLNPRLESKLPHKFKLIADPEDGKTISSNERIHKLCDLCRKPFQTTCGHYYSQREQGFELWCDTCTQKRNDSFKTANCSICGKGFKSSAYWFLMKKTDFPDKCSPCRLANREKMRAALEGIAPEESKQSQHSLYALEIKEDSKKGKGPKKPSGKPVKPATVVQEAKPKNSKFEDIMKEEDAFPSLE